MNVRIIRGQNQIGGSIIEIAADRTRIILDAGSELGEDTPAVPQVDGLFQGNAGYDAVFMTHYHSDHIGLLDYILPDIPVYMGQKTAAVYKAAAAYLGKSVKPDTHDFHAGQKIIVGDIEVTPFLCDHSAFDAYMLLIKCSGKTLLYTGDFRATGRKSFAALLQRLPPIDVLVTEGTTLSGAHAAASMERELEARAVRLISECANRPVFVFMSATNIDRLVTMYRAAKRTGRIFLQDVYTAGIAAAVGGSIPHPETFSDVRVFLTAPIEKQYKILQLYRGAKIGRSGIAKHRFVMCVRPSMQAYLERLSQEVNFSGGLLLYSLWHGYAKNPDVAEFLQFMKATGVCIIHLHTSGHADEKAFNQLIARTTPKYILPVHTENPAWFERYTNAAVCYDNTNTF